MAEGIENKKPKSGENEDKAELTGEDKSKKKRENQIKLPDPRIKTVELGFVTSIDKETQTFYMQLCKFTNKELIDFNETINKFCNNIIEQRNKGNVTRGQPKKIHNGDLVCARYHVDRLWYRALILKVDKLKSTSKVFFVDYGNVETIKLNDHLNEGFIEILPSELPEIMREPFGITCYLHGSDKLSSSNRNHLLKCLMSNYVMVSIKERQTSLQWSVDLPENAYNSAFLVLFKPDLAVKELNSPRKLTDSSSIKDLKSPITATGKSRQLETGSDRDEGADSSGQKKIKREDREESNKTGDDAATTAALATATATAAPAPAEGS